MITKTLVTVENGSVWATPEQAQVLATLIETRKGGFARIYGYEATSNRVSPTIYDATVTTRFSYAKLLERKRNALNALTLSDILPLLTGNPKVSAMPLADVEAAFQARKASELASIEQTEQGNRDDAHRQAHDRCYLSVDTGVTIHFDTAKDADGKAQPVLTNGFPSIDSIMLNCLEVSRNVRVAGEYKKVNSGVPVLIGKAIERKLKDNGVRSMNRISLKEGKFERLAIDNEVILSEDIVALA